MRLIYPIISRASSDFDLFLLSLQLHSGGDRRLLLFFSIAASRKRVSSEAGQDKKQTKQMIDKTALKAFVEKQLEGTDLFLVGIDISPDNDITVEIDSDTSVDIDRCVGLTKEIEKEFDRDEEDYRLEVGSAGLTSPFKVLRQYEKNIGNEVEVITTGGKKFKGVLQSVGPVSFSIISAE